ncbi:hypothetical protein ABT297_24040 [Dactylosporangium sp. NPDC000555]|uniref:SWIM zinc finger family protein n=1 Tax=Dactylosporangium sp. NPDC000555 TaxID=3154260 RepID=UPI00331A806C
MAEFGATPWGRAWLKTIETSNVAVPNSLLPKARSIARNDGVTSLTIQAGRIHATVALRGITHAVQIQLPPWDSQTSRRVAWLTSNARAGHPALAPGDLPDALEADLRREGIGIAVPAEEQTVECTCPARRTHCVHALATLYTLAQRIDERPAIAVDLRGDASEHATPPDPGWMSLSAIDANDFYGTSGGRVVDDEVSDLLG